MARPERNALRVRAAGLRERPKDPFSVDYFPFTEPSAEIAFDCFACEGRSAVSRCAEDGWIEAAGCGMVHRMFFAASATTRLVIRASLRGASSA